MATIYVPSSTGWQESHGNGFYLRFRVDQTYNSSTNTSSLSIKLQYKGSQGFKNISTSGSYARIDSTDLFSPLQGKGFYVNYSNTWTDLCDSNYDIVPAATYTVQHASDGSATVPMSLLVGVSTYSWENSANLILNGTPTYTVSYNKGVQGTGTNTTDTKTYGVALTLKGAIFTRTGYTQTGWSTTDGGAKAYNLSASYTANAPVVLYPFWTINTYLVSYNANGGSSTPVSQTKTHGIAINLAAAISRASASAGSYTVTLNANGGSVNPSTKTAARTTSYSFSKWKSTAGILYNAGGTYSANSSTVMTAQWTSSESTSAVTLPTPTRTGYTFKGWNTDPGASSGLTGSYTPSGNVTLYAIWEINSYTLTITQGAGSTVTVAKNGTPLVSGATIYYGDVLTISASANTGYSLTSLKVNGTDFQSGDTTAVAGAVTVASAASKLTYALSLTTNEGVVVNVLRTSSPIGGAPNGLLPNGATLYYNDVLEVSYSLNDGYTLEEATVNGEAVSADPYTISSDMTVVITAHVGAIVYIGNEAYQAYIGDGASWRQYQAYIGNDSAWVAY